MRSIPRVAVPPQTRAPFGKFKKIYPHHVILRPLSIPSREVFTEDARRRIYIDNAGNNAMLLAFYIRRAGLSCLCKEGT
ncbi:uncharacterized protein K444DRAFT_326862 [Hyaloscypha bicolor E]|uniref:Uncharacterized protein n=1 Tax=Hyaloscypha bicolor E TaxID=1095630 RepID=A0A2J6TKA4_9HELO|nr:uncharacterized protein K444DRAFT_326862 [Hyaloscypha bicolor E]PMD63426.1 hypothetical protein K444DRAFT_326862 [Hyaloscypha bicolor E]